MHGARLHTGVDAQQFVHPVRAGVAREYRAPAMLGKLARERSVAKHRRQMARHLLTVSCHQEILTWSEQVFSVRPWRADEGNAAGQRLENAYGGHARKGLHVRAPRHVDRYTEARVGAWRVVVGDPSCVVDTL